MCPTIFITQRETIFSISFLYFCLMLYHLEGNSPGRHAGADLAIILYFVVYKVDFT